MTKIPLLPLIVESIRDAGHDDVTHFGLNVQPVVGGTFPQVFSSNEEAIAALTGLGCTFVYRLDGDKPILIHPIG